MSSSSAAVRAAKSQLRCLIKERLAGMTAESRAAKSAEIVRQLLLSDEYQSARRISVYLSMPVEEVSTEAVVLDVFNSGRRLFVPRYSRAGMDMLAVADLADLQRLPVNRWGIRQPEVGEAREDALAGCGVGVGLDLILVPGLAFTRLGRRLGRGMGYYDRYMGLARAANAGCRAVALAFREQLVEPEAELPTDETDRLVDRVITD